MGRRAKNKQAPPQPLREPQAVSQKSNNSEPKGKKSQALAATAGKSQSGTKKESQPKAAGQTPAPQNAGDKRMSKSVPTKRAASADPAKKPRADVPPKKKSATGAKPAKRSDGAADGDADAASYDADHIMELLGIPKDGNLTARQRKKLLAEAERLELLLKSSGYSLDDDEDDVEPEHDEDVQSADEIDEEEEEDDGGEDDDDEDDDDEVDGGEVDGDEVDDDEDDDDEDDDDDAEDIHGEDSEEEAEDLEGEDFDDEDEMLGSGGSEHEEDESDDLEGENDEFEGLEGMDGEDGEEDEFDVDAEDDDEELEGDDGDEDLEAGEDGELEGDESSAGFLLPTLEEEEQEKQVPLDLQLVQMRIQEVVNILGNLAHLGEPGRSRADYMDRLSKDVQTYYGYNEFLTNMFLELFSPEEAIAFFEANEVPRPVTIRANTLRTRRRDLAQKLINRGMSLEPVGAWSKVGLQVFESPVPVGATPEYLVGDYMLQAVSSFLPCVALAPQPNERVLDMASAPGGKVTYLSALMQNTGCIFANDSNKARIKSLTANIHRMGCRNVVVCNYDGRQFPKVIGGFDRVMLDSPCSGTGVVSKDPSVKTNKSKRDFILLSQLQKQLILCAIDSVNPRSETGGYVVYSTCSVTVEENEEVVEYALRKRPNVRIVPTGIDFGRDGFKSIRGKKFDERMPLCRRIFPHVHNMDGFFVCKLKVEPVNKGEKRRQEAEAAELDAAAEAEAPKPAKRAAKSATAEAAEATPFDDAEDEAILERSRARQAKKRRT